MATEIQLRLITEGLEKAQKDIDRLEKSIQKAKKEAGELSDEGKALDGVFQAFGSNAVSDFKNLRKSGSDLIKNFGKLRKTGIKGLITGFRGLKTAIASTGIGLLLTLIPDIVEAFRSWASSTEELERAALAANKALDEQQLISQNILANFDTETQILKLRGTDAVEQANRELERLKLRDKILQESFDLRNEKVLEQQALEEKTGHRNNELTKRLNAEAERLLAAEAQYRRDLIVAQEALASAEFDAEKQRLEELENERRENARKAQERADAEKARLEELQALRQQGRQRELQEEQDLQAQLEQMEEEAFLRTLSDEEREVLAVQDKYFQLLTEAEQFNMDTAFLEEEQQIALKEIRDRYAAERAEQEAEEQKERDEQREKERAALKEQLDGELAARAELAMDIAGMTGEAFEVIADIQNQAEGEDEEAQKRIFERNKRLSIAQALINTFQAVTQQLAVPRDALTGANFVKAGVALATGLAQVSKISNTEYGSASASGSGSSGLQTAGGASEQQTLTPITAEGIDTTGVVQPVQAFVIGQEITNQQALDSELRLRATL